ncbi:MAG: hypothetical protein Q8P41_27640 [Pseudomonadota bacterium]|nr:hypothetical protein [Pseudomonadota bacterium]
MPATDSDFNAFLQSIYLSDRQAKACQEAHRHMRELLADDPDIKEVVVSMFLQGSIKRATTIAPAKGEKSDVDLVVATVLDEKEHSPIMAWQRFAPFLDRHFVKDGKRLWRPQGRSVGVSYPGPTDDESVELDLVVTSIPSEAIQGLLMQGPFDADDNYDPLLEKSESRELMRKAAMRADAWKTEALRIPDRERRVWENTDPLAQIRWTWRKNARTDGHYTHTVMALKWWQRMNDNVKRPKGYTLEAIVGACCPDKIANLGEAVAATLTQIEELYAEDARQKRVPYVPDVGTGLNVLARISPDDFGAFYAAAVQAARVARYAVSASSREEACRAWRLLFGQSFPPYEEPIPAAASRVVAPVAAAFAGLPHPEPIRRPVVTVSDPTPGYASPTAPARVGNPRFA